MAKKYIKMKGETLREKILSGERDFSNIKLIDQNYDLESGAYTPSTVMGGKRYHGSIANYFHTCEVYDSLQKNPFIFNGADLRGIIAASLYFNYSKFRRTNLSGTVLNSTEFNKADFSGANLEGARLIRSELNEADFSGANLKKANFWAANLSRANLSKAILEEAELESVKLEGMVFKGIDIASVKFHEAEFYRTDLRGVKNLRKAIDLRYAFFNETIVTREEREIIRNELRKATLDLFVI